MKEKTVSSKSSPNSAKSINEHWDTFELRANALLNLLRRKKQKTARIDAFLQELQSVILSIHYATNDVDYLDNFQKLSASYGLDGYVRKISSFVCKKFDFQFCPPVNSHIVGSYATELSVDTVVSVDLAIEMSTSMFHQSDFATYAYHLKSCLFLIALGKKIESSALVNDVRFHFHCDDPRKIVMQIIPNDSMSKLCRVILLAIPPMNQISLDKFVCNVEHLSLDKFPEIQKLGIKSLKTPMYNQSILRDLTMLNSRDAIRQLPKSCIDAIRLFRIWLRRRQMDLGYSKVSCSFVAMLAICLLKKRRLQESSNAWDNFKALLTCLATTDATMLQDLYGHSNNVKKTGRYEFPVNFFDTTGYVNICSNWDLSKWTRLKHEVSISLDAIAGMDEDRTFYALFQQTVKFEEKYDICFRITNLQRLEEMCRQTKQRYCHFIDSAFQPDTVMWPFILETLQQAMRGRCSLIEKRSTDYSTKSLPLLDSPHGPFPKADQLEFGMLLEPDCQIDPLVRGPPANDAQAAQFRHFWGSLSELRKFHAYGICEAVLLDLCASTSVTFQIVSHSLNRHLSLEQESVLSTDAVSNKLVTNVSNQSINETFEKLEKVFKLLDDLPFKLTGLRKMSAAFCDCELDAVRNVDKSNGDPKDIESTNDLVVPRWNAQWSAKWLRPVDVLLMVNLPAQHVKEKSTLKNLKQAVCTKLFYALRSTYSWRIRITKQCLLILDDAHVYRIFVNLKGEDALHQSELVINEDVLPYLSEGLFTPRTHLIQSLISLCHNYEALAPSIRLAKRWISDLMLSDYLRDEAVELLVISLFINPFPYTIPRHHLTAFIRFLNLIATYDWALHPLFINIGEALQVEDIEEAKTNFRLLRPTLPPFCLITPHDRQGCQWTRNQPCPVVADWLCRLAKSTVETLQLGNGIFDSQRFGNNFHPRVSQFDVVIKLRLGSVSAKKMFFAESETEACFPLTNFNPIVEYVNELRSTYGAVALFFSNPWYCPLVGVVWKPVASKGTDELTSLRSSICDAFSLIGYSLVDEVVPRERRAPIRK